MFSPWTSGIFNFWTAMSFSAIVLMNMAFALRPQWWIEDVKFDWKNIAGGVGLATVINPTGMIINHTSGRNFPITI